MSTPALTLTGTTMPVSPVAGTAADKPETPSADHRAMADDWQLISDIRDGVRAIKSKGSAYLPRFPMEADTTYNARLASAPWRPEFEDALRGLASKPFAKAITLNDDAPDEMQGRVVDEKTKTREGGWVDDVDGSGNNLHVFARETFTNGMAMGMEAIYVAFPATDPGVTRTRAEEKAQGLKPYWVRVPADCILDIKYRKVNNKHLKSHVRIRETLTVPDGRFGEKVVHRIRVLELNDQNKPTWQTWTMQNTNTKEYVADGEPQVLEGQDEIPLALFYTGQRRGIYACKPPLLDLANMQIELYQKLSGVQQIEEKASAPMLTANGMAAPKPTPLLDPKTGNKIGERDAPQITTGPGVVLFAEGQGASWQYINPNPQNITALREGADGMMQDFQRLALQPTTSKSGVMVATAAAIDAAKSHSALEAWTHELRNCIDEALAYTVKWMGRSDTVTVKISTDWAFDTVDQPKLLLELKKERVISSETVREETHRRGIFGPEWTEEKEQKRLANDEQGLEPELPPVGVLPPPVPPVI